MTDLIFAAILATHRRADLLLNRALPSILAQSRPADEIFVVQDDDEGNLAARIESLQGPIHLLANRRASGLSGALNSALDRLARRSLRPERVWAAFLDDDDAWTPEHLQEIATRAEAGAELVATPFLRIESGREPRPITPPCLEDARFHRGNPGVQGGNLAVRLDVLLEAGGFNEALPSCTDRDLCLRLLRRPGLRVAITDQVSVRHHADSDRPRLSTPGSEAKLTGLTLFDRLHGPLMAAADREAHLERAARLFGWSPPPVPEATPTPSPAEAAPREEASRTPPLLVGLIADPARRTSIELLLEDVAAAAARDGLAPPEALLLENGAISEGASPFLATLDRFAGRLRLQLIDRAALRRIMEAGDWLPEGESQGGRFAIADARTALQSCLYHLARERPGCAIWILDDDMRLDALVSAGERIGRRSLALGEALRRAGATGAAIVIGGYTGAAPLPAIATMRTQLVDLLWNLRRLGLRPSEDPVPLAEPGNALWRAGRRDYYYDLSRIETDRLETPFALEPAHEGETCGEALKRLGGAVPRMLAGDAPLRPLVADPAEIAAFPTSKATHRGGDALIFDPEALADLPNLSPTIRGRPTRRSDMIWSLLQREICGRETISAPIPLRHDRSGLPAPEALDPVAIADDLRGAAIFSALEEAGLENPEAVEGLCAEFLEERLAALRSSFFRIRGLARELAGWAEQEAPAHAPKALLRAQAGDLLRIFDASVFEAIRKEAEALGRAEIRAFLDGLDGRIERHRLRLRQAREIPRLLEEERLRGARRAILAHIRPKGELRVLGAGKEGAVFTDGEHVWKLFDRWSSDQAEQAVPLLRRLMAELPQKGALAPPKALLETPVGWLMESSFEPTEPYKGGCGPGLVELLADLHRHGVHCRNLHPDNLCLAGATLRLIDWGADLVPHDDPQAEGDGFLQMCRRAWLSWRFFWRADLKALMRRALKEPDLPELSGCEGLIQAVRERLGLLRSADPALERALALKPARVLDYGAGKGEQAALLARAGAEVTVWDPDPALAERLEALAPLGVRRAASAAAAVGSGPFDLVFCRRVACLLEDSAFEALAQDLRAAVAEGGRVLLALCHPAYAPRVRTAEGAPVSQAERCGPGCFFWSKRLRASGRVLEEVHRSESLLRRKLRRTGLLVAGRHERRCVEFERFETVADLLVLELSPVPLPETALLVKACAMDAGILEEQVRALLAATEEPAGFAEIILTLDGRRSDFPRPHASGDLEKLRAAAQRLLQAGDVDRLVEAPEDEQALRSLNLRWFDLNVAASRTSGGAATAALLAGFEACSTLRVLHADVDMMVGRAPLGEDFVTQALAALKAAPQALTASFPVAREGSALWTSHDAEGRPWRVESRIGMVDMRRMRRLLPLPNELAGDAPLLSWHRALDRAVAAGAGESLRGGGGAFCLHPPNVRKGEAAAWSELRMTIARGVAPPKAQCGRIEWEGGLEGWRRPERHEPFVFVICGRNVAPERFRRCWASLLGQKSGDWGAVVVDDASEPWIAEEIGHMLAPHQGRVSWAPRRGRAGLLANTVHAIRHLCAGPDQVIATLDADDHLIGPEAIGRLKREYAAGADLTVGDMLRTDKISEGPVDFRDLCRHRGGGIWRHLRSFRKGLFDAIPDARLRLDGSYVDLASDWAFMIPMVEMARRPVWIREALYLHEPGDKRDEARKAEREAIIARLMAAHAAQTLAGEAS